MKEQENYNMVRRPWAAGTPSYTRLLRPTIPETPSRTNSRTRDHHRILKKCLQKSRGWPLARGSHLTKTTIVAKNKLKIGRLAQQLKAARHDEMRKSEGPEAAWESAGAGMVIVIARGKARVSYKAIIVKIRPTVFWTWSPVRCSPLSSTRKTLKIRSLLTPEKWNNSLETLRARVPRLLR